VSSSDRGVAPSGDKDKPSFRAPIQKLRKRRIIETLAAFIGGGWLLVEVVERLFVGHYHFPEKTIDLTVVSVIGALLTTLLWRWFRSMESRTGNVKAEVLLAPLFIISTAAVDLNLALDIAGIPGKPLWIGIAASLLGIAWVIFKSLQWAALRPELENTEVEGSRPSAATQTKSIVVLPFTDLSPEGDQEYFCDGMAEELINVFSRIRDLKVVARTSAFSFKGKNVDVREIGRELGVDKVLEGSIRKAGDRLRISAQLINAADGYHLWSARFDRGMADVFAVQDEVTSSIFEKLKIQYLGEEKTEIFKRGTEDPEAYNLALKGRYFLNKRTEEGLLRSIGYFERMLERDPAASLGYAGLADAYNSLGYFNFLPAEEALAKARTAAEKALDLDDSLAEAHASLGRAKLFFEWKWEEAEKDLRRAIECNPGCGVAHHTLAFDLSVVGRHDEACVEILQAQALDPLSPTVNAAAGWVFYLARGYDRAIEQCEKTREIDPNHHVAYAVRGLALMEKERYDDATFDFQKALALEPTDLASLGYLGICYGRAGKTTDGLKLLQELDDLSQRKYVPPFYRAVLLLGLGRRDQALEWLGRAFQARIPWMIFLNVWPIFDVLRSDPKFLAFSQKLLPGSRDK
jgi:TolB-like protein/tetratricopeptide (TPR) repeat protein